MGLFSRRETSPIPTTNFSVYDSHMTITGDVETDGALRIDGRLEGSIHRADLIVVGEGASVVGDITARTELLSSGIVAGDIRSAAILVQEGGVVQGRLYIHPIGESGNPGSGTQIGGGESESGRLSPALLGK
jgi:cytoskeletal protein CcmA (bactofilin family)